MSDASYDVRQEQYASVIREMIRHENDVTNHRIMWLLIGQWFLANAFVVAERGSGTGLLMLALAGIFVTLSTFVMLYKSYQARDISSSSASNPSRVLCTLPGRPVCTCGYYGVHRPSSR